jgi:hypothetical protein
MIKTNMQNTKDNSVTPVKWIAAILFRKPALLEAALTELTQVLSAIDYRSPPLAFDFTDYYQSEMGASLQRILVSFSEPGPPDQLIRVKQFATTIEQQFSSRGKRAINIDPGYLDLFKVVLASYKARGNKIYLGEGVWADPTLYFHKGGFQVFPWSFPDFKTGCYDQSLLKIRELHKNALNRR